MGSIVSSLYILSFFSVWVRKTLSLQVIVQGTLLGQVRRTCRASFFVSFLSADGISYNLAMTYPVLNLEASAQIDKA